MIILEKEKDTHYHDIGHPVDLHKPAHMMMKGEIDTNKIETYTIDQLKEFAKRLEYKPETSSHKKVAPSKTHNCNFETGGSDSHR